MTLLAYAVPVALVVGKQLAPWALLPTLTLPLAVRCNGLLRSQRGVALNPLLKRTAQLLLLYSVLWSIGLWVSAG